MKAYLPGLMLCLTLLAACGKTWRSRAETEAKPSQTPPARLDQWSGRSDYVDTRWQIKSQP